MIGAILRNAIALYIALVVLFFIFWGLKKVGVTAGPAATLERFAQPH